MEIRRSARFVFLAFVGTCLLASSTLAADPPKVAVVISVKVTGNRDAYYAKLKQVQANAKRLGNPVARVWRETLAGDGSDTIHIVTEYASLQAYAEAQTRAEADAESAKLLREIEASGLRTVLGRSLMVDETP